MKQLYLILLLIVIHGQLNATNIQVTNVRVTGQDSLAGTTRLIFDLSWEKSWRYSLPSGINNWDAAWVFAKFRVGGADYVSDTGAINSGNIITVSTTFNLRAGMLVHVSSGTGAFPAGTFVVNVIDAENFEVSAAPTTPLGNAAEVTATRLWQHLRLGDNSTYTPGTGTLAIYESGLLHPQLNYDVNTNPTLGLLIYRQAEGYGNMNIADIDLQWNYALQGVSNDDIVEVSVFAIEMVYIPGGSFFLGDGTDSLIQGQFRTGTSNVPFKIEAEGPLTLGGTAAGNLANNNATGMLVADDFNNLVPQTLPASFPNGRAAFYAMKYEISQRQYVDFLNTLTRIEQQNRTATNINIGVSSVTNTYVMSNSSSVVARNSIRCSPTIPTNDPIVFFNDLNSNGLGNEIDDGQFLACNFLSWADFAAYLDWSALRPMTELEYEKATRGQIQFVSNEFAWGNTSIEGPSGVINAGTSTETPSNLEANAAFNNASGVNGPFRVGAFAASDSSRTVGGFSFWGLLDMSGNLSEIVISVGQALGRTFDGMHGDGQLIRSDTTLVSYGNSNVNNWPVTNFGAGTRGGNWSTTSGELRTSSRINANESTQNRSSQRGGRGVRSVACSLPTGTPTVTSALILLGDNPIITASGAGSSYWWFVPDGWEIMEGQGTSSIMLFIPASGSGRVATFNECGTGEEVEFTVTISQ
jgi:formylglycine-generating enzyme required for sulfatase activity